MGVSIPARIGQILFAIQLMVSMVVAAACMKLVHLLPASKGTKESACLALTQTAWRWTLLFSPWIRCTNHPSSADWADMVKGTDVKVDKPGCPGEQCDRPLFILGNHTSFFDTLLCVMKEPTSVVMRIRTYMKSDLYNLPILGTICRCVGHFAVYFKSGEDGSFKVDASKMEAVEKQVDVHLANGGWLCFFPEGQINKNPDKLMPLRYGGFKRAYDFDAKLVSFMACGNTTVWPAKAAVGGFPGQVMYSTQILAPDGTKALAAELRKTVDADGSEEDKAKPDHQLVAEAVQGMMQKQYDVLKHSMEPALANGTKED